MLIGVISDTHGLLRPEVLNSFRGVDLILHAGDIGDPSVLSGLKGIAETIAVLGNTDSDYVLRGSLKWTELIEAGGFRIYLIHDITKLDLNPETAGFDIVVHGHTHNPGFYTDRDLLFFNPGSAGPKRPQLPVSIGLIELKDHQITPQIIKLT